MLSSITDVAHTIQTIEGYYPGSLSYRLNNPGNLTYVGQYGATPVKIGNHTWAQFDSYDAGYQALLNQINLDASRGLSVQDFINKYAPASDNNNSISYANQVANASGVSVNDPLSLALNDGSNGNLSVVVGDNTNNASTVFDPNIAFNFSNGNMATSIDLTNILVVSGGLIIIAILFRSL